MYFSKCRFHLLLLAPTSSIGSKKGLLCLGFGASFTMVRHLKNCNLKRFIDILKI